MDGQKRDVSYHARFSVTHAVYVRLAADQRSLAHMHELLSKNCLIVFGAKQYFIIQCYGYLCNAKCVGMSTQCTSDGLV
jgi:hypothetical protein